MSKKPAPPLPTSKVKKIALSGKRPLPDAVAKSAHASQQRNKKPPPAPKGKSKPASIAAAHAEINRLRTELANVADMLASRTNQMGAPTFYRPEYAARAMQLCMLGYTNEDLATAFGVNIRTVEDWIKESEDFAWAIYDGRDNADAKVINALYKSAIGYEHPEDDIRTVAIGNNEGSEIIITPTIKHYPPNYQSMALWIHNRQKRRWALPSSGTSSADKTPSEVAESIREALTAAQAKTSDA